MCEHGFIGACVECDGSGQIPEREEEETLTMTAEFNVGDKVRAVVDLDNIDGKPVPAGTIGTVTGDLEVGNGMENPTGVNFGAEYHDPAYPFPCWPFEIEKVQG